MLALSSISQNFNYSMFSVTALPLFTMKSSNSVNINFAPIGYVMSHEQFNKAPYTNNINYKLTLTDLPPHRDIVVDFIYTRLGNADSCSHSDSQDLFQVNLESESQTCGDVGSEPPSITQNTMSATFLNFEFTTNDADVFEGFLIKYFRKWLTFVRAIQLLY